MLYAATYGDGVWRTTAASTGRCIREARDRRRRSSEDLAFVGSDLYAVSVLTGLSRSPDRGLTWAPVGAGQLPDGRHRPGVDDADVVHCHGVRLMRHDEALRGGPVQGGVFRDDVERRGRHLELAARRLRGATDRGRTVGADLVALREPTRHPRGTQLPRHADRARSGVDGGRVLPSAGPGRRARRCLRDDRRRGHVVPDDARAGAHGDPRGRERSPRSGPAVHRSGGLGVRIDDGWRRVHDTQRPRAGVRCVRRGGRPVHDPEHGIPRDRPVLLEHRRGLVEPRSGVGRRAGRTKGSPRPGGRDPPRLR